MTIFWENKFSFLLLRYKNGFVIVKVIITIKVQNHNTEYVNNQFNILPLNEMILCLDKNKNSEIQEGPIYTMDKINYDKVLKGGNNEKDIDSNQKQR